MTWAQRLKLVFNIDVETCRACGGAVKVIACIEDAVVIEKILTHLNEKALPIQAQLLPESRAPRAKRAGSTERFETTHSAQVALKLLLPRHERQGIGWPVGRNWLEKDV